MIFPYSKNETFSCGNGMLHTKLDETILGCSSQLKQKMDFSLANDARKEKRREA